MGRLGAVAVVLAVLIAAAPSTGTEGLDFRLADDHLVVIPVRIDGAGPYDFIVDTGSTTSVVDTELSRELGLEPLGVTVLRTASGTEEVPIVRLPTVRMGPKTATNVLALSAKLGGVRSMARGVRGILGLNVFYRLPRSRYLLDYEARRIVFDPPEPVVGARVPFDARGRSIVLASESRRFLLDTGARSVTLFRPNGLDVEPRPRAVRRLSTPNGFRIATAGWLRELEIGGVSFHRLPVTLAPKSGLEDRLDGLLPGTLFGAIYFDHENGAVVLNPNVEREPLSSSVTPAAASRK